MTDDDDDDDEMIIMTMTAMTNGDHGDDGRSW